MLLAATASAFDQVVAAERAFAAASLKDGTHAAFLAFLAPDGIEFRPTPTLGRPTHENKPRAKSTLTWAPAWVAVSAAGDLALSSGPFEFRPVGDDAIVGVTRGLFMSVWRRQPDGTWKVAVDSGIASPITFAVPASVRNGGKSAAAPGAARPSDAANARMTITSAERALAAAATSGLGAAIASRIDPDARIYRERKPVGIGRTDAGALLAADKRAVACKADQVTAAASGDLGYAYGVCSGEEDGKPKSYAFVRAWRKQPDGSFRILVDVTP